MTTARPEAELVGPRRTAVWAVLILVGLVAIGVLVQVYLIASYIFGAGLDALDAHKTMGNVVHGLEVLTFLVALYAWWGRWPLATLALSLPVVGTIQVFFADGDEWVGGIHGLLALIVFALAGAISHTCRRELGLTRPRSGQEPPAA